jgi:hypothetical protein
MVLPFHQANISLKSPMECVLRLWSVSGDYGLSA